jgi:hypothetical protein
VPSSTRLLKASSARIFKAGSARLFKTGSAWLFKPSPTRLASTTTVACHRESATREHTCAKVATHTFAAAGHGGRAAVAGPTTHAEASCAEIGSQTRARPCWIFRSCAKYGVVHAKSATTAARRLPPPSAIAPRAPSPPRSSLPVVPRHPCSSCGEEIDPQIH